MKYPTRSGKNSSSTTALQSERSRDIGNRTTSAPSHEIPVVTMDQLQRMDKSEVESLAERFRASPRTARAHDVFATEIKVVTVREQSLESRQEQMIQTADDIGRLWLRTIASAPWYDEQKEHMVCFLLDTQHYLKGYTLISIGSLNETLGHCREVFRPAIAAAAHSIIVAHNHPSGSMYPSINDSLLTRRLFRAGELLCIPLLDHVIIGREDCYSFRTSTNIWGEKTTKTTRRKNRREDEKLEIPENWEMVAGIDFTGYLDRDCEERIIYKTRRAR
ncbi:MAG: hypothetical protein DLM52_00215 [Chthoniobacterales bacterium]|nr:MAG: hypothetical protein DLM52_00215 [Chthoniobacterales bacterium]